MSKTIGNMTLKAAPVGADMIAIADSQDSNKTKKILVSAISGGGGGGTTKVHVVENVTFSNPTYSGTASDVTQYEDGHFYLVQFPNINSVTTVSESRSFNINNLGDVELDFNYDSTWSNDRKHVLPTTPETAILLYRSTPNKFYFVTSTSVDIDSIVRVGSIYAATYMILGKEYVDQYGVNITTATPTIYIPGGSSVNRYHMNWVCTQPLTSLTIEATGASRWETEIDFTTDSTFAFTLTGSNLKWLGDAAPTFEPNTSYVIAVKNGYGVCSKVVP